MEKMQNILKKDSVELQTMISDIYYEYKTDNSCEFYAKRIHEESHGDIKTVIVSGVNKKKWIVLHSVEPDFTKISFDDWYSTGIKFDPIRLVIGDPFIEESNSDSYVFDKIETNNKL